MKRIIKVLNVLLAILLGVIQIVTGSVVLGICIICLGVTTYIDYLYITQLELIIDANRYRR